MPYEVTFNKPIVVSDTSMYINDCCWGGDIIRDELLPVVSSRYERVQTEQEDWGWFIWFRRGTVALSVDIFCDDPKQGLFRIRLTSRRKRFVAGYRVTDTPELRELLESITSKLKQSASSVESNHVT